MTPETLLGFTATAILLALAPGPDNLFVLTQSAVYGRAAGWWVTLGLCTGLIVHTLAVTLGVATLLQIEGAFFILKIIGATYLLYVAWQTFRAGAVAVNQARTAVLGPGILYRRGVIMNVTNPKVAIFFLAFLPQFILPELGAVTLQTLRFGGLFMLCTLIVFGSIAVVAGSLGPWLQQRPRIWSKMNYLVAFVLAGLAVRLAVFG